MKEETIKRIITIIKEESPGTDVLLVTHHEDEGIRSAMVGNIMAIAQAMFTITYDSNNPVHANNMYGIVKNIACNIVSNPSAMAKDLLTCIKKYGKTKK